jgi:putative ABC transport system permease protein
MFMRDVRFQARMLVRQPLFAFVAIGTLALGIGANAAVFSVVRAVLLRPLPYPEGHRLVQIRSLDREEGTPGNLSPADFLDFQRDASSFARMGAHGWVGSFTVTDGGGAAERVGGVNVTEGFFPTLGVQPAHGRVFRPDEDIPGGALVAMLSHGFWERRFGSDRSVIGRTIAVNAQPTLVVGVLPADFRHVESNPDREAEIFLPYQFDRAQPNRGGHFIRGVGRLAPHSSVEQARAELHAMAARLEQQYPADNTELGVLVTPLLEAMVADARTILFVLLASVGLVLLVACANLANLQLARASSRRRELAVRASLGAGQGRLVRQMLTESLVLALAGSAVGLVLGFWATRALSAIVTTTLPRTEDIRIDGVVLGFAMLLTLASTILIGLIPAMQLARSDLHEALKEGGRQPSTSVSGRAREALIVAEVAVSIVLLVAAGLLVRSLANLQRVNPGFSPDQVMVLDVSLPLARYPEGSQMPFYVRLLERVRQLPGVREAGAINILPLSANYDSRGVQIEDSPEPVGQAPSIQARSVTPEYFAAMSVPLIRGRLFNAHDDEGTPLVVIVSQSMARRYWPNQDVIGKRVTFNSGIPRDQQQEVGGPGSREIVGVVGDVKHLGLDEAEIPMFYTPHTQQPSYHTMTLVVRATGESAPLTSAIRRELSQVDAAIPLYQVRTLSRVLAASVSQPRLRAGLLTLFAGLALLLASVGVYGVVGYLVSQRTREIGVRLALGARAAEVMRMIVAQGMRPVIIGMAAGCGAALALSRMLASMLFGIDATDMWTFAAASTILAAAALMATVLPARHALRVDPMTALRSDG